MKSLTEFRSPFFRRYSTMAAIEEICATDRLSIVAGAGVTMDKSGLSWAGMVSAILEPHVEDQTARDQFVNSEGPQFAASAAHQLFVAAQDDLSNKEVAARERMVDVLRVAMYSPGTWQQGRLAASIADFAYTWNSSSQSVDQDERRSCIVTTNYDDYLMRALLEVHQKRAPSQASLDSRSGSRVHPVMGFPTIDDPLTSNRRPKPSVWRTIAQYPARDEIACIHLHGRIPSGFADPWPLRFPVVSESDYYKTAKPSESTLADLMRRSSIIIVGASITDPPLVRALESTVLSPHPKKRWALIPLAGIGGRSSEAALVEHMRLISSRLKALRVTPIFVDYYMQLAQFFIELGSCASLQHPSLYSLPNSEANYYSRLGNWWRDWNKQIGKDRAKAERRHHKRLLNQFVPELAGILEAPHDEVLKIELWVRWKPASSRVLRLWASSVGTWSDERAMREVSLDASEEYLVSECFVAGRPLLRPSVAGEHSPRWGVYLATPIWALAQDGFSFVCGVVVVASMCPPEESSLNPKSNRSNVARCLDSMQAIGGWLTNPLDLSTASSR